MWRHAKRHVINEISIPKPKEIVQYPQHNNNSLVPRYLEFDEVEAFAYRKLLDTTTEVAGTATANTAQRKFFSAPYAVLHGIQ